MLRLAAPYRRSSARTIRVPPLFSGGGGVRSKARRTQYVNELGHWLHGGLGDDMVPGAGFPVRVEEWRTDVQNYAGTLPIAFLLAWIQKESAGSACSWTTLKEAGIFQLMYPDNLTQGHTTLEQQHPVPPCVNGAGSYVWRGMLTDEQAQWQVQGGIDYVNYCRRVADTYMAANGYQDQPGWTDSDWSYWAMVKMVHVAPAKIPAMLQQGLAGNGGVPADWDAMMRYVTGVPVSWTDNARAVGVFGQGGGSVVSALTSQRMIGYVAIGAGALALLYLATRQGRRVGF